MCGVFRLDLTTHNPGYRILGRTDWVIDNGDFGFIIGDDARQTREVTEKETLAWLSGDKTGPIPTNLTPPRRTRN